MKMRCWEKMAGEMPSVVASNIQDEIITLVLGIMFFYGLVW